MASTTRYHGTTFPVLRARRVVGSWRSLLWGWVFGNNCRGSSFLDGDNARCALISSQVAACLSNPPSLRASRHHAESYLVALRSLQGGPHLSSAADVKQ